MLIVLPFQHGVRPIVRGDFPLVGVSSHLSPRFPTFSHSFQNRALSFPRRKTSWLSRALGASLATATAAEGTAVKPKYHKFKRHRSVGDIVSDLVHPTAKSETAATSDLSSLVRVCGRSLLYLPAEYAIRPLLLPTCLRATAQRLAEQGTEIWTHTPWFIEVEIVDTL